MRPLSLTALLALVLAAGCADTGSTDSTTPPPPAPTPQASTPSAETSSSGLPLGRTQRDNVMGYEVAATALAYRQPLRSSSAPERAGFVFAGLDAKLCMVRTPDGAPANVTSEPWTLTFGDATTTEPVTALPRAFSVALYPDVSKPLAPGECVRGWIVFEVPKGKRPAAALYTPTNTDSPARSLRWHVA